MKTRTKEDYDDLPWELITEILSWIPVKFLVRFKCVSKKWYDLLNHDRKFMNLHVDRSLERNSGTFLIETTKPNHNIYCLRVQKHYPYYHVTQCCYPHTNNNNHNIDLPDSSRVLDSSYGLVCFLDIDRGNISLSIYNPTTRAVVKTLPSIMNSNMELVAPLVIAFGYDRVSDDYKVFAARKLMSPLRKVDICSLYSLKSDAWENIANPPWNPELFVLTSCYTILVNNTFHWIMKKYKSIKCFELSTQRYSEIPFPETNYQEEFDYPSQWTVLRGQLCMVTHNLDIWILKEHGNPKSWTRIFHNISKHLDKFKISNMWKSTGLRIRCIKDGHDIIVVICVFDKDWQVQKFFICCDLTTKEARKIEIPSLPEDMKLFNIEYMEPWVDSLVPLLKFID